VKEKGVARDGQKQRGGEIERGEKKSKLVKGELTIPEMGPNRSKKKTSTRRL